MVYKETDSSYGEENQERHLKQFNKIDWEKVIGMRIISKDNFDMGKVVVDNHRDYNTSFEITIEYGDHQRFKIPKETIYKIDKQNLYTTLTENETMGSYTSHTGHEKQ